MVKEIKKYKEYKRKQIQQKYFIATNSLLKELTQGSHDILGSIKWEH